MEKSQLSFIKIEIDKVEEKRNAESDYILGQLIIPQANFRSFQKSTIYMNILA